MDPAISTVMLNAAIKGKFRAQLPIGKGARCEEDFGERCVLRTHNAYSEFN